MTSDLWQPLDYTDDPSYDALHDGVPSWMKNSFWEWVSGCFTLTKQHRGHYGNTETTRYFNNQLLRHAERVCRISVDFSGADVSRGLGQLRISAEASQKEIVLADFLLAEGKNASALNAILIESGSRWHVGERSNRAGLVQRVPEGVLTSVDAVMTSGGHAGIRLSEAWEAAFGVDPNPSLAYSLAVKAVEDATIPVVSPSDNSATLGKINAQIRNTGDWSLPMQREDQYASSSTTLLYMMKMLWAGQADRHGGNHDPDLVITQEAAEVAVMTAATLVQWFTSGAVTRKNTP